MASGAGPSHDFVKRFERLEGQVRDMRVRPKAHTETKTFIVGGDIDNGLYVPPVFLNTNPDEESPEWKRIVSFHGILQTGSIVVHWELNGVTVVPGHAITSTGSTDGESADIIAYYGSLPELVDGGENWLQVIVDSGSGANLAAAVMMVTGR